MLHLFLFGRRQFAPQVLCGLHIHIDEQLGLCGEIMGFDLQLPCAGGGFPVNVPHGVSVGVFPDAVYQIGIGQDPAGDHQIALPFLRGGGQKKGRFPCS